MIYDWLISNAQLVIIITVMVVLSLCSFLILLIADTVERSKYGHIPSNSHELYPIFKT